MKRHLGPTAVFGLPLCAALLSGCTNLTGLGGSSQYGCKAPEGVKCDSVSGNYFNALQNNLPSQRRPMGSTPSRGQPELQSAGDARGPGRADASAIPTAAGTAAAPVEVPAYIAAPLRTGPRVLRLWIKPWEDADRDLNGESLVYVQIDNGRWLVDHVQRQAREPYVPIRPTRLPASAGKGQSPDGREPEPRPAPQPGQSAAEAGPAVTQALRALQGRTAANPDH